ncbi:MAG: 6-bladed beta-propeller, partial [Acidobacteriota bacterium]|nr:6-bladed beta-propeller [Acidobacteriota bacterium]
MLRRRSRPGESGNLIGDRGRAIPLAIVSTLAAGACESDRAASSASLVSDSAGVEIVTSSAPAWSAGAGYHVSDDPITVVGGIDDDPSTSFGWISGAVRLSDGRLVVLDGQSQDLRVFDRAGNLLATWGRAGEGPGEFVRAFHVTSLPGDTVAVFDGGNARVTFFSPAGEVVRTVMTVVEFRPNLPDEMMAHSCCVPVGVDAAGRVYWRH